MQCKEWDDANSELFKESHDAAVQKNSYKGRLCELISASLKSGGNAKSQENPASTLLLSSGNAGSYCMWMVSVLLRWVIIFFTNLQNPFRFPGAGEWEEKIRSLYTGILDSFLSKLHSGRNYRDIHDRWEIEFFHGKRLHFSLHTFILHKPLLFTTSPQKIFYSASPSFRSERSGEIILQNGASSWLLKLLNCKWILMAAPFYRRGAFLYKTNAYNLWFQL